MKVRIIKSSYDTEWLKWWYKDKIGEVFEVYPDPDRESYYYTKTELNGTIQELHILKEDCTPVVENTGIVRRLDDLGRIVVPKEIRRMMNLVEADPLEIFFDSENGRIIMKPYNQLNYKQMWEDLKRRKEISSEDIKEIEKYYEKLR